MPNELFPVLTFARPVGPRHICTCSECGVVLGTMSRADGEAHLADHWDATLAALAEAMNAQRESIIREAVRRARED